MTSHAFARWNLLLLVASIFAGLVFAPSVDLSALPTPEARKWVLAEVPSVAVDTTVAGKLAGMSWWGRTVDEEREAESKRVSVGVDGVALIKVDWLLRGIVRDEGGIFALVAKSAEGPLRRFAAGAAGGAVFVVRFVVVDAFVFVVVALRAGVASTSVASTRSAAAGFARFPAAAIARATSLASSAMRAATGSPWLR